MAVVAILPGLGRHLARRDVRLDADDRLDAVLLAGLVELDGAVQVAVIGERERRTCRASRRTWRALWSWSSRRAGCTRSGRADGRNRRPQALRCRVRTLAPARLVQDLTERPFDGRLGIAYRTRRRMAHLWCRAFEPVRVPAQTTPLGSRSADAGEPSSAAECPNHLGSGTGRNPDLPTAVLTMTGPRSWSAKSP